MKATIKDNKILSHLATGKKSYHTALIILVLVAMPMYVIGWQGELLTSLTGGSYLFGLRWILVPILIFVPFLFPLCSLLAILLGIPERSRIKKTLYLILGILVIVPFVDILVSAP